MATSIRTFVTGGTAAVFTVSNNDIEVFGGTAGNEQVTIASGVTGVKLDANIEQVTFSGNIADYSFIAVANTGLQIKNSSSVVIATIPNINQDVKFIFADVLGGLVLDQNGVTSFTLGTTAIGTSSVLGSTVGGGTDTTAPAHTGGTIVLANTALKAGDTSLVTFTFPEAVTGFANADVTLANGTMTNVASTDGGTIWTATFTPSTTTEDATNVITVDMTALTDIALNAGTGTLSSANYTVDTTAPTVASTPVTYSDASAGDSNATTHFAATDIITLAFSEALSSVGTVSVNDAGVNTDHVHILATGGTPGTLTLAGDGLSATFTADGGTTVVATDEIILTGATDLAGNTANLTFTLA